MSYFNIMRLIFFIILIQRLWPFTLIYYQNRVFFFLCWRSPVWVLSPGPAQLIRLSSRRINATRKGLISRLQFAPQSQLDPSICRLPPQKVFTIKNAGFKKVWRWILFSSSQKSSEFLLCVYLFATTACRPPAGRSVFLDRLSNPSG